MEVQVPDRLSRHWATVVDHAKIIPAVQSLRKLGNYCKDMPNHRAVFLGEHICARNMRFGHHQKMYRRLRINVMECITPVILINLFARDLSRNDLAKQTIAHSRSLLIIE